MVILWELPHPGLRFRVEWEVVLRHQAKNIWRHTKKNWDISTIQFYFQLYKINLEIWELTSGPNQVTMQNSLIIVQDLILGICYELTVKWKYIESAFLFHAEQPCIEVCSVTSHTTYHDIDPSYRNISLYINFSVFSVKHNSRPWIKCLIIFLPTLHFILLTLLTMIV